MFNPVIVHSGQHYDANMSEVFFNDLNLPEPDIHMGIGSGTHADQTGKVMIEFEKVCKDQRPDHVIVVGDVNTTLACAITAAKLCIPLAHVEAGLRSFDRTMPEEINRIVTDSVSDILFTPSLDANENLLREGHKKEQIIFVGNVMIDSLKYIFLTMHRPSNVDDSKLLLKTLDKIVESSEGMTIVFPVHPRTLNTLKKLNVDKNENYSTIRFLEPLDYINFISLMQASLCVVTDSGGIQEETSYLNIPCLTMRKNTERPITISHGTNELVDLENIGFYLDKVLAGNWKNSSDIDLWDGATAGRIVEGLM